eukprot:SM000221S06938  [mRNA]  locus=s221:57752:60336:- [translate_table: standard]
MAPAAATPAPALALALALALTACARAQYYAPGPPGVTLTSKPSPSQFLIQPPFVRPYSGEDIPVTYGMQNKTSNSPEQAAKPEPTVVAAWALDAVACYSAITLTLRYPLVASGVFPVLVSPADPTGRFYVIRWVLPVTGTLPGTLWYDTVYPPDEVKSPYVTVKPRSYTIYKGFEGQYTSGAILFATIGPLPHKTTFYYRMEDPRFHVPLLQFHHPAWSRPTREAPDVGQTTNSSSTYDNTIAGKPDVVLFAADLSYSDNYGPDVPSGPNRTCGEAHGLTAYNHELETVPQWNASATSFIANRNRIPGVHQTPLGATTPKAPFFYSFDAGLVHVIALSSYEAFTKYTQQYSWARQDLAAIDRAVTPFVVVFLYNPWYNTDLSHYLEGESMRHDYEGFLMQPRWTLLWLAMYTPTSAPSPYSKRLSTSAARYM